jgi:NADPH2:quinone reductase
LIVPRAVVSVAYGGPEVIDVIDVDSRPPGNGEVTFAVRSAALNPYDAKLAAGEGGADPAKLPRRLGAEAAGVVIAVGTEAVGLEGEPLNVGDAVYGTKLSGAQASELTVAAGSLLRKQDQVGFDEAAGLLLVGTTAVHALTAVNLKAGETLLLHGAGGSVGSLVSQIARLRGARVIGTGSTRRQNDLRATGVEPVLYGTGLGDRVRALATRGIDAAIDTAGTDEALAVSLDLVANPRRVVTLVNFAAALAAGAQAIGGGPGADPGSQIRSAARLYLALLLADGTITVDIAGGYPLESASEAYRFLTEGHAGGKVVLRPEP